ncbi:sirohydrochlorin chelatase [Streptomyces sp. NPDC094448]|uniref:sirohydrochlorin chelatase n=1 Tax=Streptomyces sp. NPDC094448 TaxID=3366063 RepID=UPI0038151737
MSSPTGPAPGLPVRMPRPRQSGRHRRPEPVAAPEGAPALVLAVPGAPTPAVRALAEEIISIARSELPGLDVGIGYLDGHAPGEPLGDAGSAETTAGDEAADGPVANETGEPADTPAPEASDIGGPDLATVLAGVAAVRAERYEFARAAGREVAEPEGPAAVVVPLLVGPDAVLMGRIRAAVERSAVPVGLADVLGPHPLLAEAVHVRLSEAGLARADRARLFTVATAADGIVLATVGGDEAVRAAGITGMLLAARLAVPVMAAALDQEGSVAAVAEQLRGSGSTQLALAPYLIGPELPDGLLDAGLKEAGAPAAEGLGAYPAIGKLVLSQYTTTLGITPAPQGAPVR